VLGRIQANGLLLNTEKCEWGLRKVDFLGHTISAAGIAPLPDRVAAIREFSPPQTVQQLQAFLGLFNFYRRFVPAAARILRPLTDALGGAPRGSAKLQWTAAMEAAFKEARTALADSSLLDHPAANPELSLATDASASHVGGILQQRQLGGNWTPLGFYSKKLTAAETRYSTFDRELLGVYSAILHFRHFLEGRQFAVWADHKPLVGALSRLSDPRSDRQRRQLSFVAEFTTDVRYITGNSNSVADTLSRPPNSQPPAPPRTAPTYAQVLIGKAAGGGPQAAAASRSSHPDANLQPATAELPEGFPNREPEGLAAAVSPSSAPLAAAATIVDLELIAAAQVSCSDCQRGKTSPALRVLEMQLGSQKLLVDASSGVLRPLVPAPYRRVIFEAVHNVAHPGIRASRRLISSRFVWPRLAADVAQWCKNCTQCHKAKPANKPAAAVQPLPVPLARFSEVHIDIVGPLPATSEGFQYLLTVIDRSTRWAEAMPLKTVGAANCAVAFVAGWVSRFGVPATMVSDRGVQFTSALWAAVMQRLGVKHKMTTAFHPQANGLIERFHCRLKEALKARAASADWVQQKPGCFWVCAQHLEKSQRCHPLSWCMGPHCHYQGSSYPPPSRHRKLLSASCRLARPVQPHTPIQTRREP
jgi:hypothetical protein